MILGLRVNKDKIMSLHEKRSPVLTFLFVLRLEFLMVAELYFKGIEDECSCIVKGK